MLLTLSAPGLTQHYHFRNYSIEHGLAQSQVHSLYQDSKGYLWIGTLGGGVSKFDGLVFSNFTKRDGLAENQVLTIFEDGQTNIWFGTDKGVSRYDGMSFHRLNAGNELSDAAVRVILEDDAGNLWFGTEKGAWKYDRKTFYHITEKDGLADDAIMSMLLDNEGILWFGTENGGVSRYDGKTFTNFSTADGLTNNTVFSILQDQKGTLWFGTYGGVNRYDNGVLQDYSLGDGLNSNMIRTIIEDRQGHLWFGTDGGGICKVDGKVSTCITEKNGLSSNVVWSLLEDREGNIWIGTYRGGLDRYSGDTWTYFSSKDGLGDDQIRAIFLDRAGNFWFGTYKGGVSRFDGKYFTNFTTKDGLINNFVLTIFEDKKGNLWFGTYNGISKYDGKRFTNISLGDGAADGTVRAILEDRQGHMWFGTNRGGICRFDGKTISNFTTRDGLNDNQIQTIMEDREGTIWIGTLNGICNYDGEKFTNISEKCGLKPKSIYSIIEDDKGNLWIGAYGDGILKFRDCAFEVFCIENGLNNDNVVSMSFDNRARLWIGTEKGICRFDVGEYEKTGKRIYKHYGREEGAVGIECIHNAICKDNDGNIWFGTIKGAVKHNPAKDKPNLTEPLTHIAGVHLLFGESTCFDFAESISPRDNLPIGLKLPYNKNFLMFDFIGLNFTASEKVRYQYKLAGYDDLWISVKEGSYATYSNLPPGRYTFKVKACNNNGIWNKEPTSFGFEIIPPFWQTWWFYLLCAAGVLTGIYTFNKIRIKHLEKLSRILEEKVRLSTQELKREKEKVEQINLELENRVQERTAEYKRLETQLLQAQKMEAIGTMAGGIAHDFNNLLMGILGNVSLILSEMNASDPHYVELQNIGKYVHNGVDLTRQLLGFARRGKYEVTPTDLNSIIKKSAKMFGHTRKEITIHGKYEPNLWVVEVDRGQIEQVLVNLFVNAWQAMPGGGYIYLQTENVILDENNVKPYGLQPGNYVKISITDNGSGMDEETRQRIFEPFFTTRERGRGTGLGLASVYGIIVNHRGSIQVYSEKGKGTTFSIYLPVSDKEVVKEKKLPKLPENYLQGKETILLVDDEEMICDVGEKILKRLGYSTLVAGSGQEAVATYKKNKQAIDMVILDMIMPGLGGGETYKMLKKINPGIKVLLSSGYSVDGQAAEILEYGCSGFIQKPFKMQDLAQKIRSILDS